MCHSKFVHPISKQHHLVNLFGGQGLYKSYLIDKGKFFLKSKINFFFRNFLINVNSALFEIGL